MGTKNTFDFLAFKKFSEIKPEILTDLNNEITFAQVRFDEKSGVFENIHLLHKLLPTLESYSDIFHDDSVKPSDYAAWLDVVLDFVEIASPWFYIVLVNGEPKGAIWAIGWVSFGENYHACEVGGLAKRGVDPFVTMMTIYKFTNILFEDTDIRIVRSEFTETNRAVSVCLRRLGYGHPEPRRCLKIRDGKEISGKYLSVTRTEWEALHGR